MARYAARAVGFLAVLVIVSLVVYLTLVLPNDARMQTVVRAGPPIKTFYKFKGSLLSSGMTHAEDLGAADFKGRRDALVHALPDYALPASVRFVSPYQIYVPVGSYPLKLAAQDGLFLPSGATLTLAPKIDGAVSLRFAVFSPQSAATLTYAVRGSDQSFRLDLPPPPPTLPLGGSFYKNIWRFVDVDPKDRLESWVEVKKDVTLGAGAVLQFTCAAAKYGCILGDVQFYVPQPTAPRNVLVVLVDTLRADAIDAGHAPTMQKLAAASTNFVQALAPGNMTSPSTNALLSCRRPSQLGELAFSYGTSSAVREDFYRDHHRSFPTRFREAGYDTAMIGNVSVISEIYGVGISHGFAEQISLETDGYDTPAIAHEAVQWLSSHGDHPFFLYLHFNGPHAPYRAPLRDVFHTFPGFRALSSYGEVLKWLYQGEVAYTDRYLGVVLRALADLGLDQQTTVVLTADHGDQHSWHRFTGNEVGPPFTGAYFDHGATLLNDEIRVPLVIRQPGLPPQRITEYVSTLDLGPTLLDLVAHVGADGCATPSLAPFLAGENPALLARRVIASEGFRGRSILFHNRYKYIRTYEPTDKRIYPAGRWSGDKSLFMVKEQLFDLVMDPAEEQNLGATIPALLTEARARYRKLFAIVDSYELVIETPVESRIDIDLAAPVAVRFEEGQGQVVASAGSQHIAASGRRRYLIELKGELTVLPQVAVDGRSMSLHMTSMRLPLQARPADLPAEMGGRYSLLAQTDAAVAYLRKVEDDGQRHRQITTGNPAFEKVLREWGYLNDK